MVVVEVVVVIEYWIQLATNKGKYGTVYTSATIFAHASSIANRKC